MMKAARSLALQLRVDLEDLGLRFARYFFGRLSVDLDANQGFNW